MLKTRHTPKQKTEIVLELLNTSTIMADLCRKHNTHSQILNQWRGRFIKADGATFNDRTQDAA